MIQDLNFILTWWLVIFLISLSSLPIIFFLFKKFADRGYIFSKIFSLSLLTYLIFVLSSFKLFTFSSASLLVLILLIIFANLLFLNRFSSTSQFVATIKKIKPLIFLEEGLFLLVLVAWSYVRGFASNIEGLEKFMDWGFVNSALRSTYLPPADMWFAGSSINYYYFGHLIFALLTKLSNISSAITYNLSIATVAALTFASAFSLSLNLTKKKIVIALLAASLLTFGGNLHAVYKISKTAITQKLSLNDAADKYWYPDATRFIGHDPETEDKTIHEFPLYSFVVADLHGHMNDIPIIIFFVALTLSLFITQKSKLNSFLPLLGLVLSWAYMTNAWDVMNYGLLFGTFCLFYNLNHQSFKKALISTLISGLTVIVFWYIFSLPFSLRFSPMMEGLMRSDARSPFYQLFILHGGFWLITFPFIFYITKHRQKLTTTDLLVLSLILTATILIILPEIGYIKDIYIYSHRRSNTMFKLVYQSFIMYSLAASYVFYRLKKNLVYKLIFLFVFTAHMIYPYFAISSYYGSLKNYQGLWGLNFLKDQYPDNFAAIEWIQDNIAGQPVMLEAVGDSYTTFNQVSAVTGLPTIQGWLVHEWLWRGGFDQPGSRRDEVSLIYTCRIYFCR